MTNQTKIEQLNAHTPGFIKLLGGSITAIDDARETCTFEYNISTEFCHSVDIVQGGFVTSMLDAAMSHAVFGLGENIRNVSTLEIKVSFLEATRAGRLTAVGSILKRSYKTVFLEGHLYNEKGVLTAVASAVAKLVRE